MPADALTNTARSRNNVLEHAFDRLPRPQKVLDPGRPLVPTKLALLEAKAHNEAKPLHAMRPPPPPPPSQPLSTPTSAHQLDISLSRASAIVSSPSPISPLQTHKTLSHLNESRYNLGPIVTFGTFTQDGIDWEVRAQRGRLGMIMVKKCRLVAGLKERDMLHTINHQNIVKVIQVFTEVDQIGLAFEYCRFTLAQILHVHLKLEERHIQHIGHAVFNALAYLAKHGIVHQQVCGRSIRVTTPELRIVLSGFEESTHNTEPAAANADLTDLGFVLLECMEGHILPNEKRRIQYINDQRALNKVFGLANPEQWSGCKNLVDFLDDLFNEQKPASTKFERPHRFISSKRDDIECIRPFVELVTLECFTPWTPKN